MVKKFKLDEKILGKLKKSTSRDLDEVLSKTIDEHVALGKIYDTIDDESVKQSIRNYIIIRSVSYFEKILKQDFTNKVDLEELDYDADLTFTIKDLKQWKKNKINYSIGEIIANNLNFQNVNQINKNMSELFKIDFFELMSKKANHFSEILENVQNLLEERHKIIHDCQNTSFDMKTIAILDASATAFLYHHSGVMIDLMKSRIKSHRSST